MALTIWHNPNCSTSRKVLGWLKAVDAARARRQQISISS